MKKEWFALLLLLGIILGSVLNLRFLRNFTQELGQEVAEAAEAGEQERWDAAEELAAVAMERWTEADKYTHVFIRHGEIDAVTDGFCSLLGAIRSQDHGSLYANQIALRSRLLGLYEMERLKPGSIL